jgi:hypothetical protein
VHPAGFTPVSIDWSGGTKYDNQLSATYVFTTTPGTYTITATRERPMAARQPPPTP